jgi:hypothetical protein
MLIKSKFFTGLRRMLALDANRISVGEVMLQFVQESIVEPLEQQIVEEDDEARRRELERELSVWEKYARRGTAQGRSWANKAAAIIANTGIRFGLGEEDQEEIASYVTQKLWQKHDIFEKFEKQGGGDPKALVKLFSFIVGGHAREYAKKLFRERAKGPSVSLDEDVGDDEASIGDLVEDDRQTELDRYFLQDIQRDLVQYVLKRLGGDENAKKLFQAWMIMAEKHGPQNVKMRSQVFPVYSEVTGQSQPAMYKSWTKVRKLIVKYLEDEEGLSLSPNQMKRLKMSSVEYRLIRRRLASWILRPMKMAMSAMESCV